MSLTYSSLVGDSYRYENGEANDCGVIALSLGAKISYEEAHKTLRKLGRRNGGSTKWSSLIKGFELHGYRVERMVIPTGRPMSQMGGWLQSRCPHLPALIRTRNHVAYWDGTQIDDWTAERRHKVRYGYEVIPTEYQTEVPKSVEEKKTPKPGNKKSLISTICQELGMDPKKVRRILRKQGLKAPYTDESRIRDILKNS